ncbi:MAG: anti-sigma factor family protein [Planctomycetota bacterium]|jgi:hypothetical protein
MLQGFDEAELLALIEDELDPAEAQRLRQRLAADPQALALIEQLREDRARLRATPEPEVPGGLLAELEPILARPMLMPQLPVRRRRRRPLVSAVAAAAVLLIVGGFWATLVAVLGPAAPEPVRFAEADTSPPAALGIEPGPGAPGPVAAAEETWPPPGTVIHHYGPLLAFSGRPAVAGERSGRTAPVRGGEPPLVAADFMLVVRARDATRAEQMFQRVLSDLGAEAALVRNFTYREADELGEALRLAEGARPADVADADETVADVFGGAAGDRAERMPPGRPRPRPRPQDLPEAQYSRSELLAGSAELAPSFERQLDFSERGAAYTLSVPASRLTQVLARLQLDEEHQTALRVEAGEAGEDVTDGLRWLRDWPLARQAAAAMETQGRDAVILLPVVVEQP